MNGLLTLAFLLLATVIQTQVKPGFVSRATVVFCIVLLAAVVYIDASLVQEG